ncbi:alpha/beta hydrolase [Streptomyces sp. NBC_00124]|uniref:alpha/beta fold hydrolase n=1 Tax=Streptomyces sp. NBC_00124 TaxID=2975662 RepID=UPI0022517FC6|nr:alpha/beta hydrolase [Streptomyces sp. NBC_00124]MCX5359921.1 alpha/beta hydrolase [Streptomyces sp. NBC_00124]
MTDLYYDVHGSGPVLLILPGGAGHPMGLGPLTEALADRFTVVVLDPLGLAHGRLGSPVDDQRVEDWSDGARRVLDSVLADGDTAYAVGTSAGAIVALDLLARHPERLRHVVAHEPPCVGVLPDGHRQRAMFREVVDTYRTAGLRAAAARMTAGLTDQPAPAAAAPVTGQPLTREEELSNPMALLLAHVLLPFTSYDPDLTALASAPLTLAAGTDSRGHLLYRTAEFTARQTGAAFAEFPGGHLGAAQHPDAFAERLVGAVGFGERGHDRSPTASA